jgi:hypothetical protein
MLLMMIAADMMLGYLIGVLARMHTDEDYAAWQQLKKIVELVIALKDRVDDWELSPLPAMRLQGCNPITD